ncbi:redoxin family protein [Pedobacter sp. MR22-3]|uniref:redoxin family protein n=1 Tax=Pedobacter sp. MR22-3 TaxID=2994552 RepID=UPI00224755FD|nr:redoxin family protein [Pedobacter sp. MR22-3]MCX2584380.1 redoxin family protein [Pedobacter sp. MR22-3]
MKKIILVLFCILSFAVSNAQIKVGQFVDSLPLPKLLNTESKKNNLSQLRGKVILLDFWATWCSPCIAAMPNLDILQKTYGEKLQVIAISSQNEKRIQSFVDNQSFDFWFGSDSLDVYRKAFPYSIIPHSVLIDIKGKIVAITTPENITSQIIADVLAQKTIDLPLKEDNMDKDSWMSYFKVPDTVKELFIIQPEIKGMPVMTKQYKNDPIYKNRRISFLNTSLSLAYRIAYGDVPYGRTNDLTSLEKRAEMARKYSIDLIVPKGKEDKLMHTLQTHLKEQMDVQANIEKQLIPVYVLTIADKKKIGSLEKSKSVEEDFNGNGEKFSGKGIQLKQIAQYLEGFGLLDLPVIDETNNSNRYNISFTLLPEKKGELKKILSDLGLTFKREQRKIDVLVFR